jgi:putative transposase
MQRKDYLHNPTHIFIDDTIYFITAVVYQKRHLLKEEALKYKLLDCIQTTFARYQWELQHWVILDNHYHLLVKSNKGKDLAEIIRQIHSVSGYYIKQVTKTKIQVWWNYWDYCPRDEKDYYTHLNYLLNNPIKHGYVDKLQDYPFSSFHQLLQMQERDCLVRQFKMYSDYKNLQLIEDVF